jgi:hypothetical protein
MKPSQFSARSAALPQDAPESMVIFKSILWFVLIALSTHSFSQQLVVKGQVVDAYGNSINPRIQIASNNLNSVDGKFEVQFNPSSYLYISHIGYFDIELQVKTSAELTNLGDVYMIENVNWIDGPKNGTLKDYYPSGSIKYIREVRKWKLHGVSEFYNTEGRVTQRILFRNGMPINIEILRTNTLSRLNFSFDRKRKIISIDLSN